MKRAGLFLAALLFAILAGETASAETYFSQGSVPPNTEANWNTNRLGGGSSPTDFTAGDIFVIQGTGNGGTSPHSMTTTATWTVSGTGAEIQVESGGTLTAAHAVTTQGLTIAGTVVINTPMTVGDLQGDGIITSSAGGAITLTVGSGASTTYSGVIQNGSATVALTKTGTGTLTLSGANTFTGGVTINEGVLKLGNAGALNSTTPNAVAFGASSTGILRLNGFAVTISGLTTGSPVGTPIVDDASGTPNTLTVDTTGANTYAGKINDGAPSPTISLLSLIKSGTGSLTLSGNNGYDGTTTLSAGTLNINSATAIGTSGTFIITGGTIDNTSGGPITLITNNEQNWNGDFAFTGTNDLDLGTGAVALSANRQVTVNGGTLTVGGTISADTFDLTKAGAGTLSFTSSDVSLKGLTISAGTLTSTSGTMTLKGNLSNSGTFNSNGGTVNFNGASAQTIGGSSQTAFSELTIDNGAGVSLNTSGSVGGVLTLTTDLTTTSPAFLTQSGTSTGNGDVVGNVNRTDVPIDGTFANAKSFGNANVKIVQGSTTVGTDITVTLFKSAPIDFTNAVSRTYDISKNGGTLAPSGTTLRLRYKTSPDELNGITETSLRLWRKDGSTYTALGGTVDTGNHYVTFNFGASDHFSRWVIAGGDAPTACKLESFAAARSDDGVVLEWRTGYEVNNVGFNIYRQDSSGNMVRLTPHLVAGSALMVRRGTPLSSGLSYSWTDPDTKSGDTPRYWLEDLDAGGQTSWHGPFFINETLTPARPPSRGRGALPEGGGGRSVTINSLSEQNAQNGDYQPSGPEESAAQIGKMKLAAAVQQSDLAGKPAVKISIKQEGWYRITQPQLVAAGLGGSVDPRKLQLFVDTQEMPIIVGGGNDGNFGAADYIEFYGQGLDTPSTATRVYWLIAGDIGLRVKQSGGGRSASSAGDSFPYTVQRKDKLYYFSNIQNGEAENFFGEFVYYQPINQTLNVTRIAPATNSTLELALQGFNAGPHQVQVSLNGAVVGTLNFNDRTRQVFKLTTPQALLVEGTNTVSLLSQAGSSDFSFVDYIKLTYAHSWKADNNALKLTAPGSSIVNLGGFTDSKIRVVDVTDPKSVQELVGKVTQDNQGYSINVTTSSGGTRSLLAFVDSQAKQAAKVAANKASSLRLISNQADLVIIGYGDFSSSLQSLKSLRQSQGIATVLVDAEDVYDEFSFGHKTPKALKDFLTYARSNWKKAPKYVLLGGMASFDPRNYMGLGNTDLVPTKIVMTEHLETASDDWFADFDNDGMPEMAVGRLPARNSEEAARMVQKILNYDQVPASGAGVLLVADVNKGFDFESNNDQLKKLVPPTTTVQDIRRGNDPQAKQNLLAALNQGKKLVNYTGHGSVDIWEASLLTSADASALTNSQKLSVVVAMTCLNGYFFDERFESLAHSLANAQNGGAVAIWSSTGLTEPEPQAQADRELFRQLFAGAGVRLGDAALKAKAVISDSDVRRTWVLIGDPTMRFKQ